MKMCHTLIKKRLKRTKQKISINKLKSGKRIDFIHLPQLSLPHWSSL